MSSRQSKLIRVNSKRLVDAVKALSYLYGYGIDEAKACIYETN